MSDPDLTPAEEIVEAAAPRSMTEGMPESASLTEEVVIRPWEPKDDDAVGAPPERTIEGEDLIHSPGPPQEVGGGSPSAFNSFARWMPDE